MASEVFADDIEALLERLEGVASARVVANEAGEIDRIYVTADGARDETKLRQMVTSTLMSRYSLAVDGWRIRVARLRSDAPLLTRWYMQKVEEVLTATEVTVAVELRAEDGQGSTLSGRARGLPDQANRLRTAAVATLDAMKSLLEAEGRRAAVETIATLPLAAGQAVVVALAIATASQADRYIGAAIVEGSAAEAVIAATLDAVGKRSTSLKRRGWVMRDRRDELESMQAHYRRMREPQRQMPALSDAEGPALSQPEGPSRAPHADGGVTPEDEVADFAQIRPERQGGAQVNQVNRQEMDRTRTAPKSAMEDEFFRHLIATGIPVHVRCRDGYEIHEGVVKDFGTYSLLIETEAGRELIFKHGIISVRPLTAGTVQE